MATLRRILCPVDFSEFSRHAIDHAVAIARRHEATVTALHVIPLVAAPIPSLEGPLYQPVVFTSDDVAQFRREVDAFVAVEAGGDPIESVVVQGNPAAEIAMMAGSLPADLLVMGTHGRSGFDRLMLGSVTEKVLRRAPCPVLTIPCHAPDAVPIGPTLYRRILCAIDFSPASLNAIALAQALTAGTGATLCLAHVIEPASIFEPVMADGSGAAVFDDRAAAHVAQGRLLELAGHTPGVCTEVVAVGKPYREILRLAAEQQSDLIVIGVHGGASGVLAFGSTTNQIVRLATCPVLSSRV